MSASRLLLRLVTNDVETGRSPAYPDLQPLELPADPDAAYATALDVARRMPRWSVVERSPSQRAFRAVARTRLLRFTDDVRVQVEALPGDGSQIRVRSASRVGICDLGTNARRIRAYLAKLAEPGSGTRRVPDEAAP